MIVLPSIAMAISLDDAKASGVVGETTSGYLEAVVKNPTEEVKSLVREINTKRKIKYQEIAAQTGSSLADVEKLAALKAIEKTSPGFFVKSKNGTWIKK